MLNEIAKTVGQIGSELEKHAPLILQVVGGVGLVATGIYAYDSAQKIGKTLEQLRAEEEKGLTVKPETYILEVGKDVVGPLALGLASGACLVSSYLIQDGRIQMLSGALTLALEEHRKYRLKAKEILDEAKYNELEAAGETHTVGAGKSKKEYIIPSEGHLYGRWFMQSHKYASDDPNYNESVIREVKDLANRKIMEEGTLMYSDLMELFGFEHDRHHLPFGWTDVDLFYIEYTENQTIDTETGEERIEHYISWATPRNLYAPTSIK